MNQSILMLSADVDPSGIGPIVRILRDQLPWRRLAVSRVIFTRATLC